MKRISRIERVGNGLKVTMADGSTASYRSAADLPGDLVGLLARLDSADGADGGDGAQGGTDGSRAAYMARLEQAHQQQGQAPDSHTGLSGRQLYEACLRDGWAQPIAEKRPARKHWSVS